ncbi:MAG: TolC family protein [Planctomycetaceae bacterium]|nr:MAG: TolC family protein [Planctomycetaceae bacterium]
MNRAEGRMWIGLFVLCCLLPGCLRSQQMFRDPEAVIAPFPTSVTRIETPITDGSHFEALIGFGQPRDLLDSDQLEYADLSLQEALHLALSHSKVMRDLGGTVLRTPENTPTAFGPAIQETSPQFGVEAALAAFDAEFSASAFGEKNDRRFNNQFLGLGGLFQQDTSIMQAQLAKRTVTGSQFALRHIINYDYNNNVGNEFDGSWDAILEGEFRHSLLRGGGVEFNRIAGPGSRPGVYNGVLIARLRTDISLTEFEIGIRDLLSNVENAYWDLYFAYRDLDTKIRARDASQDTWRQVHALFEAGKKGGEAEKEAQAREQYFRFEEEVQNALMGRPIEGTRTNNGSSAGTFRGTPGVYANERKLRLLLGLPPQGNELLRPSDEPPVSPVTFDWMPIATEALLRREELRRQRWKVRTRELELIASKNFLQPSLDLVGRYRWRGFGDRLLDPSGGETRFDNAYQDLTSGDFQEWQLGAEFSMPLGFRQGHAAVRNAQLQLARERSLLVEQERQVINDLSAAIAERNRAYAVLHTSINRVDAAQQQLQAVLAAYNADETKADFYILLDAQRRYADAEIRYYQARVEYALAIRNIYFEGGALLDYCSVALSEGSWPGDARLDAAERERLRGRPRRIDYRLRQPPQVSVGGRPASAQPTTESVPTPALEESDFLDIEPMEEGEGPAFPEPTLSEPSSFPLWPSDPPRFHPDDVLRGNGARVQTVGYLRPNGPSLPKSPPESPQFRRLPVILD